MELSPEVDQAVASATGRQESAIDHGVNPHFESGSAEVRIDEAELVMEGALLQRSRRDGRGEGNGDAAAVRTAATRPIVRECFTTDPSSSARRAP